MNGLKLKRLVAVGTTVMAAIAISVSPASADSDMYTWVTDRGYMHFIDDGDVFEVCDKVADGYGMTGKLQRQNTLSDGWTTVLTVTDGGDAGCDKGGFDIGNLANYRMNVSWNGQPNYEVHSVMFNE